MPQQPDRTSTGTRKPESTGRCLPCLDATSFRCWIPKALTLLSAMSMMWCRPIRSTISSPCATPYLSAILQTTRSSFRYPASKGRWHRRHGRQRPVDSGFRVPVLVRSRLLRHLRSLPVLHACQAPGQVAIATCYFEYLLVVHVAYECK